VPNKSEKLKPREYLEHKIFVFVIIINK